MKNIFQKSVAIVTTVALVATLFVGINFAKTTVKADTEKTLTPWSFFQTGTSTNPWNQWEVCAFSDIKTSSGETISGSQLSYTPAPNGTAADAKTVTTSNIADGFEANIISNGYTAQWENGKYAHINPYCLTADMKSVEIEYGHNYEISFSIQATSKKGVYFAVSNQYGESVAGGAFAATTQLQKKTFTFTSETESKTIDMSMLFGAFMGNDSGEVLDYDGTTDLSGEIPSEANWSGKVSVRDFKVVDKGVNPEPNETTTINKQVTTKPEVVTPTDASGGETVSTELLPWSFFQTGTSTNPWNQWEVCAFSEIKTSTGELIPESQLSYTAAPNGTAADEKTVVTKNAANGFDAKIFSNGYTAQWENGKYAHINPYCLTADMKNVKIQYGHDYEISFSIKATSRKGVYFSVSNQYGENVAGGAFAATPQLQQRTFTFTSKTDSKTIDMSMMLGAFMGNDDGKVLDFDGTTDLSGEIPSEANWNGTVSVSDFTIVDKGLNPDPNATTEAQPTTKVEQPSTNNNETSTEDDEPAEDVPAEMLPWSFFQTGTSTSQFNPGEVCAFSSIKTSIGEVIDSEQLSYGDGKEKTVTTKTVANGFEANIESNGWTGNWSSDGKLLSINPYCLSANMNEISVKPGHTYSISFTIRATSKKGIVFGVTNSYTENVAGATFLASKIPVTKEFAFVNSSGAPTIDIGMLFGAFLGTDDGVVTDYDGKVLEGFEPETNWSGTVYVTNFQIIDKGRLSTPYIPKEDVTGEEPTEGATTTKVPTTTQGSYQPSESVVNRTTAPQITKPENVTAAPGNNIDKKIVNGGLASTKITKATKKKVSAKVKLTFKKVAGAKKYQIQISATKKFKKILAKKTVKKVTVTISNKKLKNKKKLYVRVRAIGADIWSKPKKIKIKK